MRQGIEHEEKQVGPCLAIDLDGTTWHGNMHNVFRAIEMFLVLKDYSSTALQALLGKIKPSVVPKLHQNMCDLIRKIILSGDATLSIKHQIKLTELFPLIQYYDKTAEEQITVVNLIQHALKLNGHVFMVTLGEYPAAIHSRLEVAGLSVAEAKHVTIICPRHKCLGLEGIVTCDPYIDGVVTNKNLMLKMAAKLLENRGHSQPMIIYLDDKLRFLQASKLLKFVRPIIPQSIDMYQQGQHLKLAQQVMLRSKSTVAQIDITESPSSSARSTPRIITSGTPGSSPMLLLRKLKKGEKLPSSPSNSTHFTFS